MIEGHGDDSYKYRYPIRSNFSSNVYNKVNLDGLVHICVGASLPYPLIPNRNLIRWRPVWRTATLCLPLRFA